MNDTEWAIKKILDCIKIKLLYAVTKQNALYYPIPVMNKQYKLIKKQVSKQHIIKIIVMSFIFMFQT